ncbi:MAG: hypothetical protein GXO76_04920 [Calditrichaeota bacterium]|nr:hypothetical protein [Calditrichota bacterium]
MKKYGILLIVLFFAVSSVLAQPGGKGHRGKRHRQQQFSLQPRGQWQTYPQGVLFFNTFSTNFIGFGGNYFFRPFMKNRRFGVSIMMIPYPEKSFPDVTMYYDPYYGDYLYMQSPYHRSRSLFSLFGLYRQRLFSQRFRNEFQPYLIVGAGPLLAYESIPGRGFLHSQTQVTLAGMAGLGLTYNLTGWFLSVELHYLLIHFKRPIYQKMVMDSWSFQFGVGKYFR